MLKKILLILLGVLIGAGGHQLVNMYVLPLYLETMAPPVVDGVLKKLPYGMVIGETKFSDRPLFCIEQKEDAPSIYKRCKVSPGFYAAFTKGVLSYVVWNINADARFHKEWREVGLNTNQTSEEFLQIIKEMGAVNFRPEIEQAVKKVMTFDAGDLSYRLWLLPRTAAAKGKPVLYFSKLETILSF